ncbi:hypothetical protein AGLY_011541 [Aphis glycines]|uniref:Uncharacterized protein n=1 Tax=Aphis glycines TaxID=307491 RepID=A0A6G0TD57_APHGL|nr:hypothetical protein AGLY_011541 [Aphis glycines]
MKYNATNMLHDLNVDPSRNFENFCRMSSKDFEHILNKISPYISKNDTNMRECIPIKERLVVTLRFLAGLALGGRPKHSVWNMGFNRIKDPIIDNKYNALCMICHKTLRNTSVDRLKTHRNICLFTSISIPPKSSSPQSISNLMVSNNASKRKKIFINTSDSSDSEQIDTQDTPNENKLKENH